MSALSMLTSGCQESLTNGSSKKKPNIVFILADDMGWADLPVYGNKFNEAPNITKLADEGMKFDHAYAACPVCSPTRASIQSGQYPARVGITDFITGHWRPFEEVIVPKNRTQYLPLENITFAEKLKEAGYATGYFGKWHLGWGEYIPTNQGYDEQVVYNGGGFFGYGPRMDPPKEFPLEKVLSEALTDLSISFIERNKDKPFMLFLAHYDVHVQLDAQQELIDKYLSKEKVSGYPSNAVYAAMIEHVDNSVGRIEAKLEELGLAKNTVVIFFSDNGGLVSRFDKVPLHAKSKLHIYEGNPMQYIASSNTPLRAEKGTVYEGGIREPFIVKWPGKVANGSLNHSVVTSVDFYPTFLELAGVAPDPNQKLDGGSLVDIITKGQEKYDRPVFWHYPVYHHDVPASVIRKGDYKLIENLVDGSLELYDLVNDIGETQNLAESMQDKSSELHGLLKAWQKDVKAEFPVQNPDFNPEKRYEWGRHPDRN
ncbi:MAG: sulfatase [Cyclobacteriaceae bacterium]|nr:sulfatase [Cyclobacteriaceae bacterium]